MGEDRRDGSGWGTTATRGVIAIAIGLLGSVLVWWATPYNNFVLGNSYISDSFLPIAGLFVALVVIASNPLIRRFRSRWALDGPQLAIVMGIVLVACCLGGQGLLRMLPYTIARIPLDARDSKEIADAYAASGMRPSLFPEKLEFGSEVPASQQFWTRLDPGAGIPWGNWLPPLMAWGAFLFFSWLMMIGLAMVVYPQWRGNERLQFPLLDLEDSLIEAGVEADTSRPRLLSTRSFWVAAFAVLVLHVFGGMRVYNPDGVPAIPLNWDISGLFTEEPLVYMPGHIRSNRIYFIFLGIAYFMPTRISFSIWAFVLLYAGYVVVGRAYMPPFHGGTIADHRMGAMFALTVAVLWFGRTHWRRVIGMMCRGRLGSDEDRRDRMAGWMFVIGCAGMALWFVWAGVSPLWAPVLVGIAFMISLTVTRIVAETGIPFIRIDCGYQIAFLKLFPMAVMTPLTLYFGTVIAALFATASRVSVATMSIHALGLSHTEHPRRQMRLAPVLVGTLLIGLVVCGAFHLYFNYNHSMTLDGREQPLNSWGGNRFSHGTHDLVAWFSHGRMNRPVYNQWFHMGFGLGLAAFLEWACLSMPGWPLHPIGLIMVNTFYANEAWPSIFLGWLAKVLLTRYGGLRAFRAAKPVFMGLIMGEVFAGVFWGLVPAVLAAMDRMYYPIQIQPY